MPKVPKATSLCNIFAASLESLAHRWNVASLSLFYKYCFGRCSSELTQLVPLLFSRGRSTRYSDRLAVQPCMEWIPIKKREVGMKLIFCMQTNKSFYNLILSILVSMDSLAQSTQINNFAKSLQYLEKEVRNKVDFLQR